MKIKDTYRFLAHHSIPSCYVERTIQHLIFSVNILVEEGITTLTSYNYPDKYEHTVEVKVYGQVVHTFKFKSFQPYLESLTYTALDLLGCGNFTDYDIWAEDRYLKRANN